MGHVEKKQTGINTKVECKAIDVVAIETRRSVQRQNSNPIFTEIFLNA